MSRELVVAALRRALSRLDIELDRIHVERPKDPSHGDYATNVAMTLARSLRRPPREIAQAIADGIELGGGIGAAEVAGPGFLNIRLSTEAVGAGLVEILRSGRGYGRSREGGGRAVMVEFVSANPTGLLHAGHGRQAALGDAIASLLEWTGWTPYREFYYNDAGRQIERLAQSLAARYAQHFGQKAELPEGGYRGTTIAALAAELAERDGDRWLGAPRAEALDAMQHFAVSRLRSEQDRDLHAFRVRFDRYFLESSLYGDGRVDETVTALRETGFVFEEEGAVWLRTTQFGDQKDRVMIKSDGTATYFLPDVAYHMTKWERGFAHAINVQGSDHHGTIARMRAGLQALGLPTDYPEYVIHQMVAVERDGREVRFSKRSGDYVTLRDLVDMVGADVTRYFFLMRRPDAHLVFDLDSALDQSDRNPVYKVKYAHARLCSILRRSGMPEIPIPEGAGSLSELRHPIEREVIRVLTEFPGVVARAAASRSPHLVCDYLEKAAGAVNSWYHAGNPTRDPGLRVLIDDPAVRSARLVLTNAARIVLRNGLTLLGVEAPERMERPAPDDGAQGPGSRSVS